MYPRYSIPQGRNNMYVNPQFLKNQNEERFVASGGFIAPLLLGGIAGYAIGNPNGLAGGGNYRPNYPYNYYYNNFYYPPYYPYYPPYNNTWR